MKKNLKKLFALLLVVVMVAAMFAGCANNTETPAEPTTPSDTTDTTTPTEDTTSTEEPAANEKHENKVIYGSDTELSGDLGNAWWTNNATDKLIRDLTNDYDVITFDQFGQMGQRVPFPTAFRPLRTKTAPLPTPSRSSRA